MSTYEERIAALEQTSVSRLDFLNAVNRVMLQQAQNTTETYHEITMLLSVVGSQGQDIKTIKEDVSLIKERLVSLETKLDNQTTRFDHLETLFAQVLARLPEKP